MRKKYLKHMFLLGALAIVIMPRGWSQSARSSSDMVSQEISLTAPTVSPVSTEAWSERAVEKAEEWIAYLNLIREVHGDTLIQAQLMEFSQDYFLDDGAELFYQEDMLPINKWLRRQLEYGGSTILISESQWQNQWVSDGQNWRRTLGFTIETEDQESFPWSGPRSLEVVLSRVEKSFGGESVFTWEIRFDELR